MSSTPWNEYGMIAYISKQVPDLGKTKLQKLVYLIKEIKKVSVGYSFRFYNYGPYSDKLAENLDFVRSLDGVNVNYEPSWNLYNILPSSNTDKLIEKAPKIQENQQALDDVLHEFGPRNARELELVATLVYVDRNDHLDEDQLVITVKDLKPKYSSSEIETEMRALKAKKYILQ